MENRSAVYWYLNRPEPSGPLDRNLSVDVAVVGGGIAGLSCADSLRLAGLRVGVFEKSFVGSGATGKSSGFITPDSELELFLLERKYGAADAVKLWSFALSGVEDIRRSITNYSLACDYSVQDSLFAAPDLPGAVSVCEEHRAHRRLGYASQYYTKEQMGRVLQSRGYCGAVRYSDTFGINSFAYCQALKNFLQNTGVVVYEQTPVTNILAGAVTAGGHTVRCDNVVVCADRFIPDFGRLGTEIYHAQTFLGITRSLTNREVSALFPSDRLMVWDTKLIYNYFRLTGENRLLVGGGSLYKTYSKAPAANMMPIARKLSKYMCRMFPELSVPLEYVWSGLIGVSKDFIPVVAHDLKLPHVIYAGASAGLPWAAAVGRYAAGKIVSGRSDYDRLFSADRSLPIGRGIQSVTGTPLAFALSHGIIKHI